MSYLNKVVLIIIYASLLAVLQSRVIFPQFTKNAGGISNDHGKSIAVDASGNVYVAGNFTYSADFDPNTGITNLTTTGQADVFFAKYNSVGELIWAKNVGGIFVDDVFSIAVDGNNNIYITGYFNDTADFDPNAGITNLTSAGNYDVFFAKYNSSGELIWAKSIGGTNYDNGLGIAVDGTGNVYISGYFSGVVDFDPGTGITNLTSAGSYDAFFAKYNSSGDLVWAKNIGGANDDIGYNIIVDASGGIYVTGYFEGTADFDPNSGTTNLTSKGLFDVFFAKYNSLGALVWAKHVGGTSSERGIDIAVDAGGNVYVSGYFEGTADFDPDTGTTALTSAGNYDVFFAKYNSGGALDWSKRMGGAFEDQATSIAVDVGGNVYLSGYFSGTADFDPNAGITNLTSTGNSDVFFAKYDSSGAIVWAKNVGGTFNDQANSLAIDGGSNIYITGSFYHSADFDPDAGTVELIGNGVDDIFFAKYNSSGSLNIVGLENVAETPKIYSLYQNYPNPFNPSTKIRYSVASRQFVSLKVYDLLGRLVALLVNEEKQIGTYEITFTASNLSSGIYFYTIKAGDYIQTKKLLLLQ